jgi:hypothetical protein
MVGVPDPGKELLGTVERIGLFWLDGITAVGAYPDGL